MTIRRWGGCAAGAMLLLAGLAGCENAVARKELAWQQRCYNWTLGELADMEKGRDQMLARSLQFAEQNERASGQKFQRDLSTLDLWLREESDRWRQRQPIYRRTAQEVFGGDAASFDRTWPMVLY